MSAGSGAVKDSSCPVMDGKKPAYGSAEPAFGCAPYRDCKDNLRSGKTEIFHVDADLVRAAGFRRRETRLCKLVLSMI